MLELIAKAVPYALVIGIVLALLGLVLLVVLFLLLRRAASGKDAAAKPAPSAAAPAGKLLDDPPGAPIAPLELHRSFAAALAYLRRVTPGYRWRYAIPWYLMLGEKGAGKTTLLAELEALRPAGAIEAEPPAPGRALTWHFFGGGVVLDVAGQLVLDPERPHADERAWRQLLRLLLEHRPVRPIDGIVVTLPCSDFVGPDRLDIDALLAKADQMHRHLLDLQQRLGLQLPVYVVVSKCDWIPGFQSFWREAPPNRRDEIFGWSNGRDIDAEVTPAGFEQAFSTLTETLFRLHLDLAGKETELADPEGALLFPAEFERLREPLKLYCTSLFRRSVYHDPFFFRGLYFVGDGGPPPRSAGLVANASRDRLVPPAETRRHWPLFARDLFAKKILRERGLAAMARSGQMPRSRPVRIAAASLAAAIILGIAGLTYAGLRLDRGARSLMQPITFIVQSASRAEQRASDQTQTPMSVSDATELLGMFAKLDVKHLRSIWMPSSWFSGIDDRITEHFSLGFDTVILDAMRREFDRRTQSLIDDALAGRGKAVAGQPYALVDSPAGRQLVAYVDGLRQIETNAAIYNRLDGPEASLSDVETLTAFLLKAKLPHDFFTNSDLYSAALKHVAIRRFDPAVFRTRAILGLQAVFQPFEKVMAYDGPVVLRFTEIAAAIDALDRAAATHGDAATQLHRLGDALSAAQAMLADPAAQWILHDHAEADPGFALLMTDIRNSAFFGPGVQQPLQDRVDQELRQLQGELADLKLRRTVPLLDQSDGHLALRLSPPVASLAAALPPMLVRPFMASPEQRSIVPPGRGTATEWDADRLAEALSLYRSYELFLDADLQRVPLEFRRVVDAAARQRLDATMTAAIAKAQIAQDPATSATSPEMAVFQAAQAFGRAARPLGDLLTVLSQLGFDQTYSALREATGQQSYGLLEQVDGLLEREQLYTVRSDIRWNPTLPATLAAFGLRDDVEVAQYLDTERNWVARLASDGAAPLVDFLTRSDFAFNWRPVPLVGKWQRILLELQKYRDNNPRNSVSTLENFIRFDLAQVTRDNCVDQLSGDRFAASGDYFLDRRNALRQSLLGQCSAIAGSAGAAGYTQLADRFNRTLAGRFPFAASGYRGDTAAEVPLADLVDYLRYFAANAPAVRNDLAKGTTLGQQNALAFLDEMDKVQRFLAPFLDDNGPELPGLDVAVDFRVNRRFEQGADQIISWELSIGDQVFRRGQTAKPVRWHLSDPVEVRLRWAKDGPVSPVLQGVADAEEMKTRVVSWSYDDRWSLLHLLIDHRTPPGELDGSDGLMPQVLEFTANTVQVIGPETRAPGPVGKARAFIRVRLSAVPTGGKAPAALVMPDFPTHAPSLLGEAAR